ncbi:hypothetical protein BHM03_00008860 [Ensete ventricosum]|nr:hypothetical protein BHM03_00008860 [Ensete ventricosum]
MMRWDLAESSLGDSPKESRSLLGTPREIARKKTTGLAARLLEVAGVCGIRELGYSTSPILLVVEKARLHGFAHLLELRELGTAYDLLCSLVEHSCINPKSLTFGYLDEKSIDTGLMKFLGLCPST